MTLARVACRAQVGLTAPAVDVEVHLGAGLPSFNIVGLPATEVKESRERVRAALANAGFEQPAGRITVNLAPADLPKDGGRFDLAIAIGILLASGQLRPRVALEGFELLGELGLGGELRAVQGALLAARAAAAVGRTLVLPLANAAEMRLVPGLAAIAAGHLLAVCRHFTGEESLPDVAALMDAAAVRADATPSTTQRVDRAVQASTDPAPSLADVIGQAQAKRALLIAAAGGHSLLLVGPPGCGKSMLAQRLPALLPPLEPHEALDVATVASVAGVRAAIAAGGRVPRPFRAPHHTASAGAIIGGGPRVRPGEITLAHLGVLFLDELPEFDHRVLEALREPLETGTVSIARASLQADYPAHFQLVAAMNPCPCGHLGDPRRACRCTPAQLANYRGRLSGPLLDRIDLRVTLQPVTDAEIAQARAAGAAGASRAASGDVPARVAAARARQRARCGRLNAALDAATLEQSAAPSAAALALLGKARMKMGMSLRGAHRTLRVARTIADLEAATAIAPDHIAEAIQLRRALDAPTPEGA
jgi:magnesium chelatase family protein